ncbi:WSC domain-containing protein, partial [Lophiostoma macrostomum CBS 122681]
MSIFTPAKAFFRMSCYGRVVRERLDPIVSPDIVAPHVHTISGGAGFNPNMTFEDARASKCSSCEIKEDMSNYWTPQLYVKKKDGTFRPVPVVGDSQDSNGGMTVYYLSQRGPKTDKFKAFPEGFRMLAGETTKRSFTRNREALAISFACLGAGQPETNSMPNYRCPNGLRAQVFFPSCWNGRDLDSPDHRSHMSYPVGRPNEGECPSDFPVHLISIFYEVYYDTPQFDSEWDGDNHPFVFSNGDPTGFGFHGDFINGWDVNVLQNAVDTCLDESGTTSRCNAVTLYTAAESNSCKLPSVVDEQVDGTLHQLPGCNPIFYGPEPATPPSCPKTELSAPIGNFVDLTSSRRWEYTGCGPETPGGRAFTGTMIAADDMTVETCVDFCSSADFSYAGLEYGRECYCDNVLHEINTPEDGVIGNCTMRCAGNEMESCGNAGSMSIYRKCDLAAKCEN